MNSRYIFTILPIFTVMTASASNANAATGNNHLYANTISARNIAVIQQSIMARAIQTFEGTVAAALGTRARLNIGNSDAKMYGRAPLYGRPDLYGEYNSDATAIYGRNGGDTIRQVVNNTWLTWQHFDDDVKFHDFDRLDSEYDLIMLGLGGGHAQIGSGISSWGMYSGYTGATQTNDYVDLDEDGGYVGIYGGYSIGGLNLSASINGGALYNRADSRFGTDEYANLWAGAAARASYNIALTDTFTLQPDIYAGYTWIKSANYVSKSGEHIANKHFNTFQISPGLRVIKYLKRGWFGSAFAKYVFDMSSSGDAVADGKKLKKLDMDDYAEYGIGVQKSIDRFNIAVNIGRRDGGRTGWHGGFNLKYIF